MSKAVYPGSFDPFTNGHLDVTRRGAAIFDELVVAVLFNREKQHAAFSVSERVEMIEEAVADIGNVRVATFDGLMVDFLKQEGADIAIRGMRAISDFEYEFQLAQMNKQLFPRAETLFIVTDAKYAYLSSRGVKEVFQCGGSVEEFVPPCVLRMMIAKRNRS
ncbi:MAG: pantetheine-phosphate adenylyltransferase [Synergistaceae bacterium]|jgi:pantetheine-phosphate adenylyltransferase|nr:pantetheine-phosphate adenylyltransferase [Synergistaceae bacterium]